MNEAIQVELSKSEKDVLLRGLRYVRSAIMLDVRDPQEEDEQRRAGELDDIAGLVERLNAAPVVNTAGA